MNDLAAAAENYSRKEGFKVDVWEKYITQAFTAGAEWEAMRIEGNGHVVTFPLKKYQELKAQAAEAEALRKERDIAVDHSTEQARLIFQQREEIGTLHSQIGRLTDQVKVARDDCLRLIEREDQIKGDLKRAEEDRDHWREKAKLHEGLPDGAGGIRAERVGYGGTGYVFFTFGDVDAVNAIRDAYIGFKRLGLLKPHDVPAPTEVDESGVGYGAGIASGDTGGFTATGDAEAMRLHNEKVRGDKVTDDACRESYNNAAIKTAAGTVAAHYAEKSKDDEIRRLSSDNANLEGRLKASEDKVGSLRHQLEALKHKVIMKFLS